MWRDGQLESLPIILNDIHLVSKFLYLYNMFKNLLRQVVTSTLGNSELFMLDCQNFCMDRNWIIYIMNSE